MKFYFSEKIENFLKIILKNAHKIGLRVFFVGGIVRDNILNLKTSDIDLLVLGNAIEFAQSMKDEINILSVHKDFCTAKVELDGIQIDIASSRTELYPYSGCLPHLDKIGVSLDKDVLRRDFTINSLYCELNLVDNHINYSFIDLIDGLKDIKNKTLRVLHDKSYIDDPTRILRGLDFKYRFNFSFSGNDKKLINDYLLNIHYQNMSKDRVFKVLGKILNSDYQDGIFRDIVENKYYKIAQSADLSFNFNKINCILNDFNLNKEQKALFYLFLIENNEIEKKKFVSNTELKKEFSKLDLAYLAYYYYKTDDENIFKFFSIKDIDIFLNGSDLINIGFSQGVQIGNILNSLLNYKIDNQNILNSKQDELNWVIKNYCKD